MKEDPKIVRTKNIQEHLIFKYVKFKDNSLSGINSSINQIMLLKFWRYEYKYGSKWCNIFESLINNMANIQSDLNS